ncbi:MAG: TlpA family protein disulfide reductase [Chloroflexi bacterium]|nr:TlpA family protein disulfide reductase [Chloroflexota bacterium]
MKTTPERRPPPARSIPRRLSIGTVTALVVAMAVLALIGLNLFASGWSGQAGAALPPAGGTAAPDFRVTTLDGRTFQLSQARGKVVGLYFAAAWCPTCVPEAQAWTQIYQHDHARGLEVVMLDVDPSEGPAQWADFRQRSGNGPQLWALDPGLQIAAAYGVTSLETSIIIDRQGRIAFRIGQTIPQARLQQLVETLL